MPRIGVAEVKPLRKVSFMKLNVCAAGVPSMSTVGLEL